jgi:hypothetical protein
MLALVISLLAGFKKPQFAGDIWDLAGDKYAFHIFMLKGCFGNAFVLCWEQIIMLEICY